MHQRMKPVGHRFRYRVFSLLIDLDRLSEAGGFCEDAGPVRTQADASAVHARDGMREHMDGWRALAYSRLRHSDNDFKRIERQQLVMRAMASKAAGTTARPRSTRRGGRTRSTSGALAGRDGPSSSRRFRLRGPSDDRPAARSAAATGATSTSASR